MTATVKRTAGQIESLLVRARDERETPESARKVGADLADLYARAGRLNEAPLHEFTTDAYLGFDARATLILSSAGAAT